MPPLVFYNTYVYFWCFFSYRVFLRRGPNERNFLPRWHRHDLIISRNLILPGDFARNVTIENTTFFRHQCSQGPISTPKENQMWLHNPFFWAVKNSRLAGQKGQASTPRRSNRSGAQDGAPGRNCAQKQLCSSKTGPKDGQTGAQSGQETLSKTACFRPTKGAGTLHITRKSSD